jgi:hypothetical protein
MYLEVAFSLFLTYTSFFLLLLHMRSFWWLWVVLSIRFFIMGG